MAEYASYIYQIIDKFSPVLGRINAANDRFVGGMRRAQGGLKKFGEKAANVQTALTSIGAGAGLIMVSKKAMEFESVMTDVNKVVTFSSDQQFRAFRENILKTSVELGKLPKNLAEIAVAGGKLGVAVEDMDQFIGVVARTSVAFDMLESTAGDQIGSIQAKIGLTVEETGNLMDAVNFLADNTAASGSRMIDIIARTSGTMKSIEMPRKFMAGWAAFADQMEVSPELAASGLNMMIARMRKMPGMLELMVKSPQQAIAGLLKQLSGLDAITRAKTVDKLFGPEAGRFVLKAVTNMKKFDDTMKLINQDTTFAGSMMRELEKKLATSETAWGKVKATLDVVAITIGDTLLPYIKEAAPHIVRMGFAFREWAKAHPGIVKIGLAIAAIMAVAVPLLIIMGMVSSGITVITAISSGIISIMGTILGLVMAISAPVWAIVAAFAAVGAAVYQIWKNWDYLVDDMKRFADWWVKTFTFKPIVDGIETVVNKIKPMVDWFYKLDKFLGLGAGEANPAAANQPGIAAQNTISAKSSLNGNIVVSATEGSKVESAGLKTNVPGNLGFNLMGAMQ